LGKGLSADGNERIVSFMKEEVSWAPQRRFMCCLNLSKQNFHL